MPRFALVLALVACGTPESAPKPETTPATPTPAPIEQKPQKLDTLTMALPPEWTSTYDAEWDKWLFTTPPIADGRTASARIERAPTNAVASPDAYLHHRLRYWDKGTTAEIEKRQNVKGGFAMTVVVKPAVDPDRPKRETYVIRQLGNVWYQCLSEWVPDDAIRDQLLALCTSVKL
jgi:hypothetical protein